MVLASYGLPALRRGLLGIVLSLLLPFSSAAQPQLPSYHLVWRAAPPLPALGYLPMRLALSELLAAQALSYATSTQAQRLRPALLRAGSRWAWLSTALLSLALLWARLALRTARRFNQALATQLHELRLELCSQLLPTASPALPPVAETLALPALVPVLAPAPPQPMPSAQQQQALHELRQAASAALEDADFGPAQLAELLALGERTLYRHVKELTGLTPAAFLRELRLQHAHQLLEARACPTVAEAAYQSGFNDPSYFGQVFQKRFGKKPSAYL